MCTILEMRNALNMETSHFAKIYLTSANLAFSSLISNTATSLRVKLWVRIKFMRLPLLNEVQQFHLDKLLIDVSLSNSVILKYLNAPEDFGHHKYNSLGISHSTSRVLVSSKEKEKKKKKNSVQGKATYFISSTLYVRQFKLKTTLSPILCFFS